MILCVLLCMHVANGYPAELSSYHNAGEFIGIDVSIKGKKKFNT